MGLLNETNKEFYASSECWEFIEKYLPNYSSSNDVSLSNDLAVYIECGSEISAEAMENLIQNYSQEVLADSKQVKNELLMVNQQLYAEAQQAYHSASPIPTDQLASKQLGTGSRNNAGKLDYSLIHSPHLLHSIDGQNHLFNINDIGNLLDALGDFQLSGDYKDVARAMIHAMSISGYDECEYSALDSSVEVFTFGVKKYGAFNWMKGMSWSTCIGCIHRHILKAYAQNEHTDEESGLPHIAHVICNLQMLMFYTEHYKEGNDLPCSVVDFLPRNKS